MIDINKQTKLHQELEDSQDCIDAKESYDEFKKSGEDSVPLSEVFKSV